MIFKILNEEELTDKERKVAENHLFKVKSLWNNRENRIISEIVKRTGLRIKTEKITCYLNLKDSNGYYGEDNIVLGFVEGDIETDIMVISHELFHIFYWRKIKELNLTEKNMGGEELWEWRFAETTAYLLQEELKFLWPNAQSTLIEDIKETLSRVREIWKKEQFEDYLKKSYETLRDGM